MDYVELNCIVNAAGKYVEIVIARLAEKGYEMFEETDGGVKAYIPAKQFSETYIEEFYDLLENGVDLKFSHRVIPAQNWNAVWESNFEPVVIGNEIYVRADFHPSGTKHKHEIVIHPRMAFGTGHHATTSLVMEQMLDLEWKHTNVLDMGCGTGILSILASRLGAEKILAIDNDPVAVTNTADNASENDCSNISVLCGNADDLENRTFDRILANINRNIIVSDLDTYSDSLIVNGIILLSGFFTEDKNIITEKANSCGLNLLNEKGQDKWCCLVFKKSK